jgi:hypothetical protein
MHIPQHDAALVGKRDHQNEKHAALSLSYTNIYAHMHTRTSSRQQTIAVVVKKDETIQSIFLQLKLPCVVPVPSKCSWQNLRQRLYLETLHSLKKVSCSSSSDSRRIKKTMAAATAAATATATATKIIAES